jgi:amino-acid N-acetyltransferase
MRRRSPVTIRSADASHARKLHALITATLEEGRLLPRTLAEIKTHADRFVIGVRGPAIVGCAELAPLGAQVAEVRSLAVDRAERGAGVGAALVDKLRRRARRDGYEKLCVFTHAPGYFIGMGFSIVPHLWLLEKLFTDCVTCPHFRRCGQYAMVVPLDEVPGRAHEEARSRSLEVVMSVPGEA